MQTILLIDGENFKGLLDKVLKDIPIERRVFYFARIKEHEASKEKSKQLVEEQRLLKTHWQF